jgi:hypothetical protein
MPNQRTRRNNMHEGHFQDLSDAELEQASGGVSINLTLGKGGVSLSGPLGELSIPNPFALVGKLLGGALGAVGDLFGKVGGALSSAGQLFDFG